MSRQLFNIIIKICKALIDLRELTQDAIILVEITKIVNMISTELEKIDEEFVD